MPLLFKPAADYPQPFSQFCTNRCPHQIRGINGVQLCTVFELCPFGFGHRTMSSAGKKSVPVRNCASGERTVTRDYPQSPGAAPWLGVGDHGGTTLRKGLKRGGGQPRKSPFPHLTAGAIEVQEAEQGGQNGVASFCSPHSCRSQPPAAAPRHMIECT